MRDAWVQAWQERRTLAGLIDLAIHALVLMLVLGQIATRSGTEAVIVAALLFPITYLLGPLTLGIAAGEWLPFILQLTATVGAVAVLGVPRMDRDQTDSRSCLQLLASTLLVVLLDLVLHVAALALVVDRISQAWGSDAALLAVVLFPLTYLIGPIGLAFTAGDWLPLVLQLIAIGLIGLIALVSET